MSLKVGQRVGSYEIMSLLGKSGFAEIYRAFDVEAQTRSRIKVLPDEFSHDFERVARFQRETEVVGSLNHPQFDGGRVV